jgi:hypothetical protein
VVCSLLAGITLTTNPLAAQAAEVKFADAVMKGLGSPITSSTYTVYGGKARVDISLGGWVAATSVGKIRSGGVDFYTIFGGTNSWGGGTTTALSNAQVRVWWTYGDIYNGNLPLSGIAIV